MVSGCGAPGDPPESDPSAEGNDLKAAVGVAPLVVVATISEQPWQESLELSAQLQPWASVTIAAEAAGRVVALPIEHGDRVRRGDIVARLDATRLSAERNQTQARLDSARAALQQAERDLERGRALSGDDGILSADDLERRQLQVDTQRAAVQEADAQLAVASERLDEMVVRAPFGGVASERMAEIGSWLMTGQPVMRLVDQHKLKVRAAASQLDRVRITLEARASVEVEPFPGIVREARLRFLGQESDALTATYLVEAEVDPHSAENSAAENPAVFLPGMQGVLRVVLGEHRDLLIPRTAVLDTGGQKTVFVLDGDTAHRRQVEVDRVSATEVRVLAGLEAGERIIVQGQHRLADGNVVEVRGETEALP